ncbi:MAG TPA: heavy metal transporter CzcA, partial [Gammaproteobacteria bacterium]|nr:heavy metal transporter CzcA [Gammaproteobacteria bacterium]
AKKMKKLEQQMYQFAKNMEFEEAAKVRDALRRLQNEDIGISS